MGKTVRRRREDDDPIEYDWTPQHQCGEPMRYIGGSRRMYCPKCDLKKARLANSVASHIAEHWEGVREKMVEVDACLDDLMDRAEGLAFCGMDSDAINNLYFTLNELWDAAALVEYGIQEREGHRPDRQQGEGPPAPPGKRRVSIRIEEVAGEGLEP